MTKELVLFLGSIRPGEFEAIRKNGFAVGVIHNLDSAPVPPAGLALDLVITENFSKGDEAVRKKVLEGAAEFNLVYIFNSREAYVRLHSWLCGRFGLPGIPEEAVQDLSDKTAMRAAFLREIGPEATSNFKLVKNAEELKSAADSMRFPLIMKPNNLAASLFVRKISSPDELEERFNECRMHSLSYFESETSIFEREPQIQIEEFIEGSLHSVDAIVLADGTIHLTPIIDVMTGKDLGRNDFHHYIRLPRTRLTEAEVREASELAKKGIQALALRSCVAHVEFIFSPRGPKLLEIAGRPGAHRNNLLSHNHGVELNASFVRAMLGLPFGLHSAHSCGYFSIITPFPEQPQAFRGLRYQAEIRKLPSFKEMRVKVASGDKIGPAASGFYSSVEIELESANLAGITEDLSFLREMNDRFFL